MRLRPLVLVAMGCLLGAIAEKANAAEAHGSADLGIWYLKNNISNNSAIQDDGVGENHIFDNYSLARFGFKLDALDLTSTESSSALNAHFDGKLFYRLTDSEYTLGFSERTRQEIDALNLEAKKVGGAVDLWVGRQLVYEAGGEHFDGLRGIYSLNSRVDIALYGGLGADPRQLTGYIGPAYEKNPFSLDFQTFGLYSTYRGDQFKSDNAFRTLLFKGKMDRLSVYSQSNYQLDAVWSFSGTIDADIAGEPAVRMFNAFVTSRPVPWVTNTASFQRWRALQFKESDVSAIPVPAGYATAPVGDTTVNGSSYNSARDHIQFRIFQRNYIFAAFQYTRRTFDNLDQYKYTLGYRDPRLFGSSYDIRLQTDLIDNYRGFNTAFDTLLGKEWSDGLYRLEGGAVFYANERDIYAGLNPVDGVPRQTDKEYSLKLNAYFNPNRTISWLINYALYHEVDATNLDQKVNTHEVYLSTNIRF